MSTVKLELNDDQLKKRVKHSGMRPINTFQISNRLNIHQIPDGHFTIVSEFCRLVDDKILATGYFLGLDFTLLQTLGCKFGAIIDEQKLPGKPFKKINEKNLNKTIKMTANLYKDDLKPHFEAMVTDWLISGDARQLFKDSPRRSSRNAAHFIKRIMNDNTDVVSSKYSLVETEYRLKSVGPCQP